MAKIVPTISVGVPVYNGAEFLSETLSSLCGQTYCDIEIIVSDNASTDATESICREFARQDSRVRYERLATNLGAIENFNRLVGLAHGKYFKWAAADDLCAPTFLESLLQVMESDPELVWSHTQFGKIDQNGVVLSQADLAAEGLAHSSEAGLPRAHHASDRRSQRFRGVLLGSSWCADAFGLMRMSVIRQAKPLLACFGAEKVLIGELALRGKFREFPETLFYQRVHAAAAGNIASREAQAEYMAPKSGRKSTSRMTLLQGHLRSVMSVEMTVVERAQCLQVVAEYLLQVSKWKDILRSEILRKPLKRAGAGG